ncbi:MAG: ATP-binding cassette domain-containing protein, partial [Defluviitaleaceae bacterium]|nr:ATP-binding cassette domain-containing protein [Defluviitaleaceae bacterium]
MSEAAPLIEIKHLSKTYTVGDEQVHALKDINININEGEVFGFIGQSGAGKSSLVRCLAALEPITSGKVLVGGVDLSGLRGEQLRFYRRKLGLVFQHFNLLMNSTVYDNIAFPLKVA